MHTPPEVLPLLITLLSSVRIARILSKCRPSLYCLKHLRTLDPTIISLCEILHGHRVMFLLCFSDDHSPAVNPSACLKSSLFSQLFKVCPLNSTLSCVLNGAPTHYYCVNHCHFHGCILLRLCLVISNVASQIVRISGSSRACPTSLINAQHYTQSSDQITLCID